MMISKQESLLVNGIFIALITKEELIQTPRIIRPINYGKSLIQNLLTMEFPMESIM